MLARFTLLILLSAVLPLVAEPPAASASGCFLSEIISTGAPATIRDEPRTGGAVVRHTSAGESLNIISSQRSNGGCWLQTSEGWLIDNSLVTSDSFSFEAGTEATLVDEMDTQRPTCFEGPWAFINGPMNIRQSPTTSSPVVARGQPGDAFTVFRQNAGVVWCWLEISKGWMAVTARVHATGPKMLDFTDAKTRTEQSGIDNCCFVDRQCTTEPEWIDGHQAYQTEQCAAVQLPAVVPSSRPRIEGLESFVVVVRETLNLMERKTPEIYQYVVSATSVIKEHGPDRCDWGLAYVDSGTTSLGSCLAHGQFPTPLYVVAAYLAHEACHHHGDDINMETGEFDHEPCYKAGQDAYAALSA